MAQLVSVFYGSDGVSTFDGTNYQFYKMPDFLKLNVTYASILAYGDLIASAVATHDAVVIAGETHDKDAVKVAAADFKECIEISTNFIYSVVAACINDKIKSGLKGILVPERNIKYYCMKCQVLNAGPNASSMPGLTNYHMPGCGHDVDQVKENLYALHKTLTTSRT
jgi:hypothetical protein